MTHSKSYLLCSFRSTVLIQLEKKNVKPLQKSAREWKLNLLSLEFLADSLRKQCNTLNFQNSFKFSDKWSQNKKIYFGTGFVCLGDVLRHELIKQVEKILKFPFEIIFKLTEKSTLKKTSAISKSLYQQ